MDKQPSEMKPDSRSERVGVWLAKTRFGPVLFKDPSRFVIVMQWTMVALYFPLALVSQWIPLIYIVFMTWFGGVFYAWRGVIKATSADAPVLSLGALLSTVFTELLKYIFLFAALFDLFGIVLKGGDRIDGVWQHVYFSTVTITTLGYGNLLPSGIISEVLAATEACVGFLFFAVVAGFSATIIVDRIRREPVE